MKVQRDEVAMGHAEIELGHAEIELARLFLQQIAPAGWMVLGVAGRILVRRRDSDVHEVRLRHNETGRAVWFELPSVIVENLRTKPDVFMAAFSAGARMATDEP